MNENKTVKNTELPVIVLDEYYRFGKEEIKEISFARAMTTADIFDMNPESMLVADYARLAYRLTGYPPSFYGQLAPHEMLKIMRALVGFFQPSPSTGGE